MNRRDLDFLDRVAGVKRSGAPVFRHLGHRCALPQPPCFLAPRRPAVIAGYLQLRANGEKLRVGKQLAVGLEYLCMAIRRTQVTLGQRTQRVAVDDGVRPLGNSRNVAAGERQTDWRSPTGILGGSRVRIVFRK